MSEQRLSVGNYSGGDIPVSTVSFERTLTKQEAFMLHEINITFMSKGCIIRVGCKTFAFSSTDEAFLELQKYFEEPLKTQERWTKILSTI